MFLNYTYRQEQPKRQHCCPLSFKTQHTPYTILYRPKSPHSKYIYHTKQDRNMLNHPRHSLSLLHDQTKVPKFASSTSVLYHMTEVFSIATPTITTSSPASLPLGAFSITSYVQASPL